MNAPIIYVPNFVPDPNGAFVGLWEELAWLRLPGVPRREYYVDLKRRPYTYGKGDYARTYQSQAINGTLLDLWAMVTREVGCSFDAVFLNGYEDGSDQLGWHSDDSPEMDDSRPIPIISLGAEREIMFREIPTELRQQGMLAPERQKLQHGSLCLMRAGMQDTHQHRIPKAGFVCGPRISITFRGVV